MYPDIFKNTTKNYILLTGNDFEALYQGVKASKWRRAVVIEIMPPHSIRVHYEKQPTEVSPTEGNEPSGNVRRRQREVWQGIERTILRQRECESRREIDRPSRL